MILVPNIIDKIHQKVRKIGWTEQDFNIDLVNLQKNELLILYTVGDNEPSQGFTYQGGSFEISGIWVLKVIRVL